MNCPFCLETHEPEDMEGHIKKKHKLHANTQKAIDFMEAIRIKAEVKEKKEKVEPAVIEPVETESFIVESSEPVDNQIDSIEDELVEEKSKKKKSKKKRIEE